MDVEAIISSASVKHFKTISCLEKAYFELPNTEHLISVFENRHLFTHVAINPTEEKMPKFFNVTRQTSGYSVVSSGGFKKNFKAFTRSAFESFDYSNCILLGGSVSGK
jgi:hypothetical protein